MLNILKNNRKIILIIIIILLIPFIMPIIEILYNCLINLGRILGTNLRLIEQGICFK